MTTSCKIVWEYGHFFNVFRTSFECYGGLRKLRREKELVRLKSLRCSIILHPKPKFTMKKFKIYMYELECIYGMEQAKYLQIIVILHNICTHAVDCIVRCKIWNHLFNGWILELCIAEWMSVSYLFFNACCMSLRHENRSVQFLYICICDVA